MAKRSRQLSLFHYKPASKRPPEAATDSQNCDTDDEGGSSQSLLDNEDSVEQNSTRATTSADSTGTTTCSYRIVVPDDIAVSPQQQPVQPVNIQFPATSFSGKQRSFNPAWFRSYKWLEYSVKLNACFCYPCRLFGSSGGGSSSRPVQVFTMTAGNMPLGQRVV